MATLDLLSKTNEKTGTVDLDPGIFEARVKPHLFHAEVRRQLAERRQGTHSTKNRALVSGGGAKPYRQKGTGRARQGTTRAPQFAGGGSVFGPVPRGHGHKLPKKVRRAALISALSAQCAEGAIKVIDALDLDEYKTKAVTQILDGLGLSGKSVLIVIGEANEKVEVSARNIPGVGVVRAAGLNVYDLLRHKVVLFTQPGLDAVVARLSGASQEASS